VPPEVPQIAGWIQGVSRLGVPDLLLTDAGLGITNPGGGRKGDTATALPSAQALALALAPPSTPSWPMRRAPSSAAKPAHATSTWYLAVE